MKDGYDGAGIPISRSGPTSGTAMPTAPEAWDSRGVPIARRNEKDGGGSEGSRKSVNDKSGPLPCGAW